MAAAPSAPAYVVCLTAHEHGIHFAIGSTGAMINGLWSHHGLAENLEKAKAAIGIRCLLLDSGLKNASVHADAQQWAYEQSIPVADVDVRMMASPAANDDVAPPACSCGRSIQYDVTTAVAVLDMALSAEDLVLAQ